MKLGDKFTTALNPTGDMYEAVAIDNNVVIATRKVGSEIKMIFLNLKTRKRSEVEDKFDYTNSINSEVFNEILENKFRTTKFVDLESWIS
ncbi:MAG: hypothetical protein ACRDDY_03515 [Clostridium sp.]|uniref:hypothetical protein n=1 Tax=Clostridium sp. TaxID=1506 RepID=UPI003EE49189